VAGIIGKCYLSYFNYGSYLLKIIVMLTNKTDVVTNISLCSMLLGMRNTHTILSGRGSTLPGMRNARDYCQGMCSKTNIDSSCTSGTFAHNYYNCLAMKFEYTHV